MTITISDDFDGGNIEVRSHDGGRFDLAIRKDAHSDFYQWFYFRVDGAAGQDLTLNIVNAGASAYPGGWKGYRACVSADNADWVRTETEFKDGALTIRHRATSDSVWFAYFPPYSSERHATFITRMADEGVVHRVLGKTHDGRDIDLLTIDEGEGPSIWLFGRQHPGETMAEWWMEGALEFLISDDPVAADLRTKARFNIVPNMNPDGSARGHLRTNALGVNLNREWADPSETKSPEVLTVRAEMDQTGVDFAIDVHGDEAIPHVFMDGFESIPSRTDRMSAVYRAYLDRLLATTPDFQTAKGYPSAPPGKANLTIGSKQVAERFGAVSMTLEMPFIDHNDAPDALRGWSAQRSKDLGRDCLRALADILDQLPAKDAAA